MTASQLENLPVEFRLIEHVRSADPHKLARGAPSGVAISFLPR
jgi:hypothetical protein